MKLIDLSPLKPKRGQKEVDWATRLQAILKHGWKWYQRHQAEDTVLQVLSGVLDNRFTVVRGFRLPGEETPLPPVVLGPPGVFLLYVWPKAGFFRIREGQWEVMQGSNRRYRPGKPNMVQVIKGLSTGLAAFLEEKTVITIAHRLSTIKSAAFIYVLEDGKVADCGTAQELLQKDKSYFSSMI
jgi:hypothetical protein